MIHPLVFFQSIDSLLAETKVEPEAAAAAAA